MYAIVDIETTGLGARGNKITEISIFVHDGTKVINEFTTLVNPEVPISYGITRLTGITDDMVRKAPKFHEIAKDVLEYTQDCIFVAHSVNFDFNVIKHELQELGSEYKRKKLCTVRLSRKLMPGQRSYSLGNLCTTLGIKINGRHRARGDAEATVILFEKLLALDNDDVFDSFLNKRSRQATLPPLLPKKVIDELPNKTGVYYFKDVNGKVIYVGKAIDIKQRVLSHLYSKANKELKLCNDTANITYQLTGNEFVALLQESDDIKRLYPKYNHAQKRNNLSYGIGTYQDRQGVIHVIYNSLKVLKNPILKFYNKRDCIAFLEALCEKHELCPRYCNLQNITGGCFHYQIKKCRGVCRNTEDIQSYNKRVQKALELLLNKNSYVIKEAGRKANEVALILIKNGTYQGFGYTSKSIKNDSLIEVEKAIQLKQDNADIQRILNSYLNKGTNTINYLN
ncbi:exonuclease domain-containing protein [Flavivirga spongiicola]|uniref:Exonuclease domain-containing protein n=1 Tax=Flavivirga spongiicola TaxID=421621 RepID=A0ABU7XWC6_9FLAO|nr:exonuclease domain-containing protein [Flavivirga sp. MEBiC05379]MDO5980079.1 exonuclease domain-containing protein [Flavivirga sp. MEBiC05379]